MEAAVITRDTQERVLDALRALNGRATLGDVVAATGESAERTEITLRELLGAYRGHLSVGESGDLLWQFDPKLIRRDHESAWSRFKRSAKRFLKGAFKAWIVTMLVVYFVLFVILAVTAVVVVISGDRRGGSRRRRGGFGFRIPSWWIFYLFWTRNWRFGRPYYGDAWERRHGRSAKSGGAPFYKKVFAFVFGPDEPRLTQEQQDRDVIELIRARRGVVGTAELMAHTGWTLENTREQLARLMAAHRGDVQVTEDGHLLYTFPELMVSAHGQVAVREPPPGWRRLERPRLLTGNSTGTNALVAGINGFNLVASAAAPWTILPALGMSGAAAMTALVWVPLTYSILFFSAPLLRRISIRRENAERRRRNIRRVLMAHVQQAAIRGDAVHPDAAAAALRAALGDKDVGDHIVADQLGRLATDLEADVAPADTGGLAFRFTALRRELEAAQRLRSTLRLEQREVGAIVYSTADTATEASRRELANLDAELRRRLPSTERLAYEELEPADEPVSAG